MLEIKYIYESVYIIRYRDKTQNKDYVSIYSSYHNDFYSFDFVKSNEYLEYKRKYARPISYIPKEFIELYYADSFKVYIQTINRLRYSSKREILRKIRINTKYIDNLEYKEYLYMGIYYFKIRKYLKKIKIDSNDIKRKIYLSYLCLYHNENAGLFLFECGKLGILNNCKIGYLIGLLKISYSLGSLEAKKLLYEQYSLPRYYDEYFINKYS